MSVEAQAALPWSTPKVLTILPVFDVVEQQLLDRAVFERGCASPDGHATLHQLVSVLCRQARRQSTDTMWWHGFRAASTAELAVLRRRVIGAARPATKDPSHPFLSARSFPRLLAAFFEECSEGMVEPAELTEFVRQTAPSGSRLTLLARLWSSYRASLYEARLLDAGDQLRVARDALKERALPLPTMLAGVRVVEVREQYAWTALRLSFLIALAERLMGELGPPERLRLVIPYSHQGQRLFHYLEPTLVELETRSDLPVEIEFAAIEDNAAGPPGRAAAELFSDRFETPGNERAIELSSAATRWQEMRALARRIHLLVEEGTAPDDIAVGLRHPQSQWRDVARALEAYGIPWHYRRTEVLSDTPLLHHLVEILRAMGDDLPRETFERIVSSTFCGTSTDGPAGQTGLSQPRAGCPDEPFGASTDSPAGQTGLSQPRAGCPDEPFGAPTTTPDRSFKRRASRLLRRAGVRNLMTGRQGQRSGYEVRLMSYVERQRRRSAAPTVADDAAGQQERADASRILDLVNLLGQAHGTHDLVEWARILDRLTPSLLLPPPVDAWRGIWQEADEDQPGNLTRSALKALARDQRSFKALRGLVSELADAGAAHAIALSSNELAALVMEVASEISINPTGSRGAAVRILPVRQMAGLSIAHVFLPQINEGLFPEPAGTDPLFKDAERFAFDRFRKARAGHEPAFRAFAVDHPPDDDVATPVRRSEEIVLFCLALASASVKAHVSWCRLDDQDRPLLPSLFVDGLSMLSRGDGMSADTLAGIDSEPYETLPSPTRIVSMEEMGRTALSRAGLELISERSQPWLEMAGRSLGPHRLASVIARARAELARHRFFQLLVDDGSLRRTPPSGMPSEILPYLGYLQQERIIRRLAERRFRFDAASPVSATRLERYGQCPARFFFSDVLRLRPDDEVEEETPILSRGSLLHAAMERLYTCMRQGGHRSVAPLLKDPRGVFTGLLERAMDQAVEILTKEVHLGHPRLLSITRKELLEKIGTSFERAANPRCRTADLPLGVPTHEEWSFGVDPMPVVPVDLGPDPGTVHLTGRIDRIDLTDEGLLLITDYKLSGQSGQKDKLKDERLHRRDFQLSIYAVAALTGLPPGHWPDIAVQFFCFDDGKSVRLGGPDLLARLGTAIPERSSPRQKGPTSSSPGSGVSSPSGAGPPAKGSGAASEATSSGEDGSATFVTLDQGLAEVVRGMRKALFPAATRGCDYCDMSAICRVSDRIREASKDALSGVQDESRPR